jgi:hypothetical protein
MMGAKSLRIAPVKLESFFLPAEVLAMDGVGRYRDGAVVFHHDVGE